LKKTEICDILFLTWIEGLPDIKKRATPAGSCLPIQVLLVSKQCKTARSILRNFLWNKKAGNARWKLLAYPSFACIQTMQNGKIHFAQFPME